MIRNWKVAEMDGDWVICTGTVRFDDTKLSLSVEPDRGDLSESYRAYKMEIYKVQGQFPIASDSVKIPRDVKNVGKSLKQHALDFVKFSVPVPVKV